MAAAIDSVEGQGGSAAPCPPPDFPRGIPLTNAAFQNWAGNLNVPALWIATARSPEDVETLANWAKANGYTLRPCGEGHNWSPLVAPNGTDPCGRILLVDVTQLTGQPSFQLVNGVPTATFGIGTTVEAATLFLESLDNQGSGTAPGYTFLNMTAPGKLTLGGVLAIGAHGTSVPWKKTEPDLYGCMSNLVVAFSAVVTDPDGTTPDTYKIRSFTREEGDAVAFLVHLGRAFLVQVTLRVVPNYYLQVANSYPNATELFQHPLCPPTPQTLSSLLDNYGRLEVIWFPFTDRAWVKTWEREDQKIAPQVAGPYNYPWANNIDLQQNNLIRAGLFAVPSGTPEFGYAGLTTAEMQAPEDNKPGLNPMNGTARDLLLYVQDDTLRVIAFGYVVQIRRDQVQEVANTFFRQYLSLLLTYEHNGKYPINGPVEMRFTSIDRTSELGVPAATPPALSAGHSIKPADTALDTVFWLDVLTLPGTRYSDDFFVELYTWMAQQWGAQGSNSLRPEWSKGWAYTAAGGAWSDQEALTKDIPAAYNQPAGVETFSWAKSTLQKYDKYHIYTNNFLNVLLPG